MKKPIIIRTPEEIKAKISQIADEDYFGKHDNRYYDGEYIFMFEYSKAEITLEDFVKWLTIKDFKL